MIHPKIELADFGTGQKTLPIYLIGTILCILLTLLSFWTVISGNFSRNTAFIIIYSSACVQFIVQLICFIRLITQTEQGKINVMSLIFTGVILLCIIVGSLWIMSNLHYNMLH